MADEKLTAATRIEKLLDNIAGGDNEVTPATRLEKFLSYIADAMEGGGGSGGGGDSGGDSVLKVLVSKSGRTYTLNKTGSEIKEAFETGTPVYLYIDGEDYLPYDSGSSVTEGNLKGAFLSSIDNFDDVYFFEVFGAYFDESDILGKSLSFSATALTEYPSAGGAI